MIAIRKTGMKIVPAANAGSTAENAMMKSLVPIMRKGDVMICENCGEVFDADECAIIRENMGEHFGSPAFEEWAVCPFCRSTDITYANE